MFRILRRKFSQMIRSVSARFERKEKIRQKAREAMLRPDRLEKVAQEIPEMRPIWRQIQKVKKPKKALIRRAIQRAVKRVVERRLTPKELDPILDELVTGLIEADVAYQVAERIREDLRKGLIGQKIRRGKERDVVIGTLRKSLLKILALPQINLEKVIRQANREGRPALLLFLGFNGVGKSLSLSKTAKWLKGKGHKPLIAAGDTWRAAGIHQLAEYANAVKVPILKQAYGADSCAVIFDARQAAQARSFDVVLADTAGRSHTDKNLMAELEKICRVNKPDLNILVLDSLTGSDVVAQFELFDRAVGVDAIIFTKLDVNERGGNILSVAHLFGKPILFLGTGQRYDQLELYKPEKFIKQLIPS
jgi:fused signal recognition particle receptor